MGVIDDGKQTQVIFDCPVKSCLKAINFHVVSVFTAYNKAPIFGYVAGENLCDLVRIVEIKREYFKLK